MSGPPTLKEWGKTNMATVTVAGAGESGANGTGYVFDGVQSGADRYLMGTYSISFDGMSSGWRIVEEASPASLYSAPGDTSGPPSTGWTSDNPIYDPPPTVTIVGAAPTRRPGSGSWFRKARG